MAFVTRRHRGRKQARVPQSYTSVVPCQILPILPQPNVLLNLSLWVSSDGRGIRFQKAKFLSSPLQKQYRFFIFKKFCTDGAFGAEHLTEGAFGKRPSRGLTSTVVAGVPEKMNGASKKVTYGARFF